MTAPVLPSQPRAEPARQHTPTPWTLCGDGRCSCLTISCPDHPIAKVESGEWGDEYPALRMVGTSLDNKYEAYMERIGYGSIDADLARANARFIVDAVNSHASLKEALNQIAWMDEFLSADAAREMMTIAREALTALPQSSTPARATT